MKASILGEGKHELGDLAYPARYRDEPPAAGALTALLGRLSPHVQVSHGQAWKDVVKFSPGRFARAETRAILGAAQNARDNGCEALVFVRDRDDSEDRETDVEAGLAQATRDNPQLRIAGGVAAQALEGWVLALKSERGSELHSHKKVKSVLQQRHAVGALDEIVEVLTTADFTSIPEDALSLRTWLNRVRAL